jgi:hypothetical protein
MSRYSKRLYELVHAIDATLDRIAEAGLDVRAIYLPQEQYDMIAYLATSGAKEFDVRLMPSSSIRYRGERLRVGKRKRIYSQFGQSHDITAKPLRRLSRAC